MRLLFFTAPIWGYFGFNTNLRESNIPSMKKIVTSKYFALFILTLLISGKLIAQTTITSSITINQDWVNTKPTPWIISNNVTVTFGQNFTITNTNQYFIITGTNVTIDGGSKIVTVNGVSSLSLIHI